MSNNPWFGATMGLVGIIAGYATATMLYGSSVSPMPTPSPGTTPTPTPTPTEALPAPTGTAPTPGIGYTMGDEDATVTLIEFTDFDCPFCVRHYEQVYPQIKKDYVETGKVKYELRNLPLVSLHPNADVAAEAANCAGKQNKFWEMHDLLFENQPSRGAVADPAAEMKKYAAQLGLNATQFASCLDNHETEAAVQADVAAGGSAGIDGTPGFWVVGPDGQTKQIVGAYPYETFKAAFDEMLN